MTAPRPTPGARKIPAPFSRPRIDLDAGHGPVRDWVENVPVHQVKVGDTVADVGTIDHISVEKITDPFTVLVVWINRTGNRYRFQIAVPGVQRGDTCRAFTAWRPGA